MPAGAWLDSAKDLVAAPTRPSAARRDRGRTPSGCGGETTGYNVRMDPLPRRCVIAIPLLLAGTVATQPPAAERAVAEPVRSSVQAWLEQPVHIESRARAVEAILDDGRPALIWLGDLLREVEKVAPGSPAEQRRRALESLTTAVALDFIDRVQKSGMFFAGQYDDLRVLQPHVGNLYLNLLLETPDWFAEPRRTLLIPALRDLYPTSPGEGPLRDVRDIAEDEELESWDLRLGLSCALAQWGDRELIDLHIRELRKRAALIDAEDRLEIDRTLAQTYHLLRDYEAAAREYRQLLRGAEAQKIRVRPEDYYNAACSASLIGDLESALDELAKCVALMRSETVDVSLMLKRDMFERDRELDNVRKTKRFAELVAMAFPPKQGKGK